MKLIHTQWAITQDMLRLSTVDPEQLIKDELKVQLKAKLEDELGHSLGEGEWAVVCRHFIEWRSIYRHDMGTWTVTAAVYIPESFELFTEKDS